MQIKPDQLAAQLKNGLQSLYTLLGDEALLLQEAADTIRTAARANGFTQRICYSVAGLHFDWSEVLTNAASLSLFAERQLIELRIPSGKPGKPGALALTQLAARSSDTNLTLLTLPRLDKQSRDSNWFAALQRGVIVELPTLERSALPQWIAQRLARQRQRVAAGAPGQQCLQFFADRVEGNLLAAHQEIEKLALLYPAGELTFTQVESAVLNVARYDVFKLCEAVLAGQSQRVHRMLEGLQAEGVAAVLVHYTLAEDIRALKRVKAALKQGQPLPLALREQRVWGTRERLFERVLPRLSEDQLAHLLKSAHQVDGIVKGLKLPDWPNDDWQALQRLAQQLCNCCAAPSAQRARAN